METDYTQQNVLVTGGAGFIGSHVVDEFVRRGALVTIIDDLSTGKMANLSRVGDKIDLRKMNLIHDDVRPILAEKDFKVIMHFAANAEVPTSVANPLMDFEKNAVATFNLLEAVRAEAPTARLINTSSAMVYGKAATASTSEDSRVLPVSPYAVSKLAAENYAAVYSQLYGLRTASLRLFPVYGPRLGKQVIYDLMFKIHNNPNELPIQGDGTQVRDFNYIANVVEAFMMVAEHGKLEGEVYNVAYEDTITIDTLARMLCERMEVTPNFAYSGAARAGDIPRIQGDISRIKSLGYRPRVKFADGLDLTVSWFRQEMKQVESESASAKPSVFVG